VIANTGPCSAARCEDVAPRRGVAQVGGDEFELATRRFARHAVAEVVDHLRHVDVQPAQRGRQVEAIGTRVEPGGEVEHGADALRDARMEDLVHDGGAHDQRPGGLRAFGHRGDDRLARARRRAGARRDR
jgi:hypothetical protein